MSKPLTDMLKKDGFSWTDKAREAFEGLKQALITAPILALPDPRKIYVVETDACDIRIGAVLI